jgi:hypothetical protein
MDDSLCLSVNHILQPRDAFVTPPVHKVRSRRRNLKDYIDQVNTLPPAPFSMEIVMEDEYSQPMAADDGSLSAIFHDSISMTTSTLSKKDDPFPDHPSFLGVDEELNALYKLLQRADVGSDSSSSSSSLHGSSTSLRLEDIIEFKHCLAAKRKS